MNEVETEVESVPVHITEAAPAASFEDSLRELEEVVRVLESGNVPLEQALELLRKGLSLADGCDATLAQAELVLEQLRPSADGELMTEPMEFEADDEIEDELDGDDLDETEDEDEDIAPMPTDRYLPRGNR